MCLQNSIPFLFILLVLFLFIFLLIFIFLFLLIFIHIFLFNSIIFLIAVSKPSTNSSNHPTPLCLLRNAIAIQGIIREKTLQHRHKSKLRLRHNSNCNSNWRRQQQHKSLQQQQQQQQLWLLFGNRFDPSMRAQGKGMVSVAASVVAAPPPLHLPPFAARTL